MNTFRIVVLGRVQGVGFRAFVYDVAKNMNIRGEVWNRKDGAVEILAQHEENQQLKKFVEELWAGPGRIEDIRIEEKAFEESFSDFRITYRL